MGDIKINKIIAMSEIDTLKMFYSRVNCLPGIESEPQCRWEETKGFWFQWKNKKEEI